MNWNTVPVTPATRKSRPIIPDADDHTFSFVIVNEDKSIKYINFIGAAIE